MKLTIEQEMLPFDITSLEVVELPIRKVFLDGKRVNGSLSEIILTGLDVMSGTYGKSIIEILEEQEIE
jgi:hypothetical protein